MKKGTASLKHVSCIGFRVQGLGLRERETECLDIHDGVLLGSDLIQVAVHQSYGRPCRRDIGEFLRIRWEPPYVPTALHTEGQMDGVSGLELRIEGMPRYT